MYDNLDDCARNSVNRCKQKSDVVEGEFADAMTKMGFVVKKTSVEQDKKHKDFWITDCDCHICKTARQKTQKIMRELKEAGCRMKQDAKYAKQCREYRKYLVQENNRGNNYYCLISREDAIRMSFMTVKK